MKKTKIICTMGPNTNDREIMKQLALNGMDVARFNFSHGDYEEHMGRFKILGASGKNWSFRLRRSSIPENGDSYGKAEGWEKGYFTGG